jgi:hypothetical protein
MTIHPERYLHMIQPGKRIYGAQQNLFGNIHVGARFPAFGHAQ